MGRAIRTLALVWLGTMILTSPAVVQAAGDPMQRIFRFHNELGIPIYPVISAGQDKDKKNANAPPTNCPDVYGFGTLLRIVVNGHMGRGKGIQPGETVDVHLPKASAACPRGLFYKAGRVDVFTVSPDLLDERLKTIQDFKANANQTTAELTDAWTQHLCQTPAGVSLTGCWGGKASGGAAYGSDLPNQLAEFTIIAVVNGVPSDNPDAPNGVSNIGFNISYVDHAYIPLAMAVAGGEFGYLGSALDGTTANTRLTTFLTNNDWSEFAAWTFNQFENSTIFGKPRVGPLGQDNKWQQLSQLVARTDKLPSGDIVLKSTRTGKPFSGSAYTYAVWDGVSVKNCIQKGPNKGCAAIQPPPSGDCCPAPPPLDGSKIPRFAACCDTPTNALVSEMTRTFDPLTNAFTNFNPTLSNIVDRWLKWKNGTLQSLCTNPPASPVEDKVGFCQAFKRNIDFAWEQLAANFNTDLLCNSFAQGSDAYNQCIVAAIVGYDIDLGKTGFVASACECPNTDQSKCAKTCTDEIQRTETVQALLRSVPFNGFGPPATCAQCPSADEAKCPRVACVAPQNTDISPNANLYQHDKFLHFWAPSTSDYNLNPYAHFVHNKTEGLDALSAYGFSIDDFYGFLGANGTTLVFNVGGKSKLDNRDPRDPFTQYSVNTGPGWSRAKVCGREFTITNPNANPSFPVSFWKDPDGDGIYQKAAFCAVTFWNSKNQHMSFLLEEKVRPVTDRLLVDSPPFSITKINNVPGLSGGCTQPTKPGCIAADTPTWANRGDGAVVQADSYCQKNSHPALQSLCAGVNLSPHGSNQAYVGVVECASSKDQMCGRPLMNLNFAGCKATNQC
jgi:hypothetical protein